MDYFLYSSPDEIAWQTRLVLGSPPENLPQIAIRPVTARGVTEVIIFARAAEDLFARIAWHFERLQLTIVEIRMMVTDDRMVLNTCFVLEKDGGEIRDGRRCEEILTALKGELRKLESPDLDALRSAAVDQKEVVAGTEVTFSADTRNDRTVMHLLARDQQDLLLDLGIAFSSCGVNVKKAKLAKSGDRMKGIFFLTTLSDSSMRCLRMELASVL